MRFKFLLTFILINLSMALLAQIPAGYYNGTDGLIGDDLRTALHNIIDGHHSISYDDLWEAYEDTDRRSDGKVWDTYSTCTFVFSNDQCGNYQNICDCYNREHTVPQSWFNEASPMVSDLFHVIPTDGKVNGYRSNYPFGECSSGTTYGLGKLGSCSFPGYSGTVFEPADEYKGDMARIYFYMATRYMDVIDNWPSESQAAFSGNNLSNWTRIMMLQWHHDDPVSQKEIDRNNAVYNYQENRNPYVDNPEWADAVWDPNYVPNSISTYSFYFDIFPNPASEFISVSTNLSISDDNKILIFDCSGRIVCEKNISTPTEQVYINNLSSGMYILTIYAGDKTYYKIIEIAK